MKTTEAYEILEVSEDVDSSILKEQYRWLVWFYHPDNKSTGNAKELLRVIEAYRTVEDYH